MYLCSWHKSKLDKFCWYNFIFLVATNQHLKYANDSYHKWQSVPEKNDSDWSTTRHLAQYSLVAQTYRNEFILVSRLFLAWHSVLIRSLGKSLIHYCNFWLLNVDRQMTKMSSSFAIVLLVSIVVCVMSLPSSFKVGLIHQG